MAQKTENNGLQILFPGSDKPAYTLDNIINNSENMITTKGAGDLIYSSSAESVCEK